MNTAHITSAANVHAVITIRPLCTGAFTADINGVGISSVHLPDQSAAEFFAAGLAMGLRAAGRTTEVVIDVPEETTISEDDADLLDFASFDDHAWAAAKPRRSACDA